MNHSKYGLLFVLAVSTFGATSVSSCRAANSEWNNLIILKPGQLIRVERRDAKSHEGVFQALSNEGITLREGAAEQTLAQKDVLRVYFKDKNHRLRNILMGAACGATLAAIGVSANHVGENIGLRSTAWEWPLGLGAFAAIGAAMPTGRCLMVYHARRHRGSANSGH
jgi:hypothetical protein